MDTHVGNGWTASFIVPAGPQSRTDMLDVNRIRQSLKAGPLSSAYGAIRNLKRKLKGEPLVGTVRVAESALTLDALLLLGESMADHARYHFSLALAHLEAGTVEGARRAEACLRAAELLRFESKERLQLYRASAARQLGKNKEAKELATAIRDHDLTDDEKNLRRLILSSENAIASPQPDPLAELSNIGELDSLLVCGDEEAVTCRLLPIAKYFLVAQLVNGLTCARLAALADLQFDAGIGSEADRSACESVGIVCRMWLTVDSWGGEA